MNIPSLPTDNLYKFKAIFGLFILIFVFYFPFKSSFETIEEVIACSSESQKSGKELQIYTLLSSRCEAYNEFIEKKLFEYGCEIETGKKDIGYSELLNLSEIAKNYFEITIQLSNMKKEMKYRNIDISSKLELHEFLVWKLFFLMVLWTFGTMIGLRLVYRGFKQWNKMQILQDEILKRQHEKIKNS